MKKILFLISLVFVLVSCKDGILVNQYDKGVNMVLGENNSVKSEVTYESDKAVLKVNGVTMNFIKVEGGTFQMGSNDSEAEGNEKPVHSVTLSDYYIGETEVTQALWVAVMGDNPSEFQGDDFPVDNVSWGECQTFISKLNQLARQTFTMPTEAQWEYAARGGVKSQGYYYSGSNAINDVAWWLDNSSEQMHSVKTKKANELGLYDMSGNVFEYCQDWKGTYPNDSQTDPTGPSYGSYRIMRGGCWASKAKYCRPTYRGDCTTSEKAGRVGLRLVLAI